MSLHSMIASSNRQQQAGSDIKKHVIKVMTQDDIKVKGVVFTPIICHQYTP
jgi:hypothetical protein